MAATSAATSAMQAKQARERKLCFSDEESKLRLVFKGGHACQTCNEMSICYFLHELPIGVTLGASSEAKVPPVPGPSLSAAPYLSPLHLLPDTPSVLPHMSGGGNDE